MSLINEALKKAQRQRHGGAPEVGAPSADSGGSIAKRAQPKSAASMLWIGVGAVVLVVASMVGTALWLTRSGKPETTAVTKPARVAVAPETEPPAPVVTLPVQPAPVGVAKETPTTKPPPESARRPNHTASVPAAETVTPAIAETPVASPATVPAASAPTTEATAVAQEPAPAPPAKPAAQPNERIHQFVESLKVAGIRSSGAESKVLMNDRVYRVNEYVDRSLGVRLTKVSSDSLTFTDDNGVTYVKYF